MFRLEIKNTENDAFGTTQEERAEEVARILGEVAKKVADGYTDGPCFDGYGNRVGSWSLDERED